MRRHTAHSNIAAAFKEWCTVPLGQKSPEQYLETIDQGGAGALHIGKYACPVVLQIRCAEKPSCMKLYRAKASAIKMAGATCGQLFKTVSNAFKNEVLDMYAPEAALALRIQYISQKEGEIVILMTPPLAAASHPDDARFLVVSNEEGRLWLGGIAPTRHVPVGAYVLIARRV